MFFFCVLHIFQNFPCTLGGKSKSVSFSRVYVCVKAKLTLVSFFYFFLCTFPLHQEGNVGETFKSAVRETIKAGQSLLYFPAFLLLQCSIILLVCQLFLLKGLIVLFLFKGLQLQPLQLLGQLDGSTCGPQVSSNRMA